MEYKITQEFIDNTLKVLLGWSNGCVSFLDRKCPHHFYNVISIEELRKYSWPAGQLALVQGSSFNIHKKSSHFSDAQDHIQKLFHDYHKKQKFEYPYIEDCYYENLANESGRLYLISFFKSLKVDK